MDSDTYAEWLRRQGYKVVRSASSYWYNRAPGVLQAFPYHWLIQPSEEELRDLTLRKFNVAVRYSTPLASGEGMVSYHVLLAGPYELAMLRPQARNGIRRGLQHCRVERIPLERLARDGWPLQRDTLKRHGRLGSMTQTAWERICLSAQNLAGFEAWAAIMDGDLTASILTARIDDTCYVPFAQSHHKYMPLHANNALFYEASRNMLAYPGVKKIFFTLHSLDAPDSIDEFKFRMGFMACPVRQRIYFNPLLRPFASRTILSALKRARKRFPFSHTIAKAEGMLRFYVRGKQPLGEQVWPACLQEYRARALASLPIDERDLSIRIYSEP